MEFLTTKNLPENFISVVHQKFQFGPALLAFMFLLIPGTVILIKSCVEKWSKHKNYSSKRNTESGIQVLSLIQIVKTLIQHKFVVLSTVGYLLEKYKGAFKFTIGIYKFVIVCRPSIIKRLYLSANPGHLHKPVEFEKIATKIMQGTLFTLQSEKWKGHKSVLARAFTYNSLQEQIKIFECYAKKLVFTLNESEELKQGPQKSQVGSKLNLGQSTESHIIQIILHIASGKDIVGNHVESTRFCHLIEKLKQISLYRAKRVWRFFDILWFFHPKSWEHERIRIEIESMFAKALKTAAEENSSVNDAGNAMAGKSLIEIMVKKGFTDKTIFKEILMFIIVTNEVLPMTLRQLFFHLSLNWELQEKCRLEVGQMFEKLHANADVDMSIELLGELNYLEQCIKETIRMYPGLLFPGRMLESPLILDESTTIAPGTRVYVSTFHLHRDPMCYPEPEKFDPERFSPENEKKRGKCEYMGFSDGPRNCIGNKSAILELKVLASYVLYNFELYTNNTWEGFEAEMGPERWPVVDPKVEFRRYF